MIWIILFYVGLVVLAYSKFWNEKVPELLYLAAKFQYEFMKKFHEGRMGA